MSTSTELRKRLPVIVGGLISLIIIGGIVLFIKSMLNQPPGKPKKFIQTVTLIKTPPPPPPEVKPPEPVKQEVKIKQPEPQPKDIPDTPPDAPPPGDLGLDAAGVAGSDAFGLLARSGGRDIIGGGGSLTQRQYGMAIKSDILDFLSNVDALRKGEYDIKIKFWFDANGKIKSFKLLKSTGNKKLDKTMKTTLARYVKLPFAPPDREANSITIRLVARG